MGGVPAYLLYNYIPREAQNEAFKKIMHQEQYGITFTEATPFSHLLGESVLSGTLPKVPTFNSLHPHPARPLHTLICNVINGLMNISNFSVNYELTYYNIREITEDRNWERSRRASIGFIQPGDWKKNAKKASGNSNSDIFRPKYRLVFGDETATNNRKLYRVS